MDAIRQVERFKVVEGGGGRDRLLRLAVVQAQWSGKAAETVDRYEQLVRQAAEAGAQVVLMPELFSMPYFPQTQDDASFAWAAPALGHPLIGRFARLAKELEVVIPVSFFERSGPIYYNSVALVDADGAVLDVYRKAHIPAGPGYQEKFYFRPGDVPFRAHSTRYARIGVAICWDQWFPEVARAMALAGADVVLYPTAIGNEPAQPELNTLPLWRRAMQGHAVCNGIAVAAANRVGQEGELRFYGSSFVANPCGELVAELSESEEGVASALLDLSAMQKHRASFGFFRDRRPDLYDHDPRPVHLV